MRDPKFFTALLCAFGAAALAVAVVVGSALAASLVKNGSFEKDGNGDGIPNSWTPSNLTPSDKRVCNQSYTGTCSFKTVGDGTQKHLAQLIDLTGGAGDSFELTFWAKSKAIDLGATGTIVMLVRVYYDETTFAVDQDFSPGSSPWTKYVLEITAAEDYGLLVVELFQDDLVGGKLWVDKVKLVEVP
jgi:hypothetical protein